MQVWPRLIVSLKKKTKGCGGRQNAYKYLQEWLYTVATSTCAVLGMNNRQQWNNSVMTREWWGESDTVAYKIVKKRWEWLGHVATSTTTTTQKGTSVLASDQSQWCVPCLPPSTNISTITWHHRQLDKERNGACCVHVCVCAHPYNYMCLCVRWSTKIPSQLLLKFHIRYSML